ncbi:hypothetical protein F4803DRAFT_541360 [Xylaria telfairii]|nr:hypothetical protein F4803DRAFT_541360 [Xylaria telfairii]
MKVALVAFQTLLAPLILPSLDKGVYLAVLASWSRSRPRNTDGSLCRGWWSWKLGHLSRRLPAPTNTFECRKGRLECKFGLLSGFFPCLSPTTSSRASASSARRGRFLRTGAQGL